MTVAVIHQLEFDREYALKEIRAIPLELTQGARTQAGRPQLADSESEIAKAALEVIGSLCEGPGSRFSVRQGVGIVRGFGESDRMARPG
jgi:hypothetical protein